VHVEDLQRLQQLKEEFLAGLCGQVNDQNRNERLVTVASMVNGNGVQAHVLSSGC
jgi:hypothetical protein